MEYSGFAQSAPDGREFRIVFEVGPVIQRSIAEKNESLNVREQRGSDGEKHGPVRIDERRPDGTEFGAPRGARGGGKPAFRPPLQRGPDSPRQRKDKKRREHENGCPAATQNRCGRRPIENRRTQDVNIRQRRRQPVFEFETESAFRQSDDDRIFFAFVR